MPEATPFPRAYGAPFRGITMRDVELAADTLLRSGERPTIERVREKIGRGSPNTINPLLDVWWKRIAARLDAGPAALHRLPESVAHVAEALWTQALDEARRRVEQELNRDARNVAKLDADLEVRSHVLTLREGELTARIESRERDIEEFRRQVRTVELATRKAQATIDAQLQRIASLEKELLARVQRRPAGATVGAMPTPKSTTGRERAGQLRRPTNPKARNSRRTQRNRQ
jgi:hypothetical protein